MDKADMYEAIYLVNRGVDEAIRGLDRLKRANSSGLQPEYFEDKSLLFELQRASINECFCNRVEAAESRDEARLSTRYDDYRIRRLDEVQLYKNVKAIEERRSKEGKTPVVRFVGDYQ